MDSMTIRKKLKHNFRIVRNTQDLMFTATEGKFPTPAHIGMAVTFLQATHSKDLVDMCHHAGNIMSDCVIILPSAPGKRH